MEDHYQMKNVLRYLYVAVTFLLMSSTLYAATPADKLVNINYKSAAVETVLNDISKQSGLNFFYSAEQARRWPKITVRITNKPAEEAIRKIAELLNCSYEIKGNFVRLTEKTSTSSKIVSLRGTVRDNDGSPLPGVSVKDKNNGTTTITQEDGSFFMHTSVPTDLVFTFIGMKTLERKVRNTEPLDIYMKSDVTTLDEVIVNTGYQTINQRHLSSAVTTLKMDDINVAGVSTIDNLLNGHVPGMTFMQNSGQVGSAPKLRIRGTSTILGNQEPLWVLDGVILNDPVNVDPAQINDLDFVNLLGNAISGLNPDDIDQIDVLKDASATALYGTRAGNGVIVITTKKGQTGPPRISYNVTGTMTRRPRYTDRSVNMMNSLERVDVSREMIERGIRYVNVTNFVGYEDAYLNYSKGLIDYNEYNSLVNKYETMNTDWFDVICRDAFSQNHTVSLSGGGNNIKYYASVGYNDDKGSIKDESNKRYSTTLNVTADYKKLHLQFSIAGNSEERNYNPSSLGLMNYAYYTSRAIPLYNEDGSLYFYQQANAQQYLNGYNVVNEMQNSDDNSVSNSINARANLVYKILRNLRLDGTFAYSTANTNQETWYGENSYYIQALRGDHTARYDLCPAGGELTKNSTRNKSYTGRLQMNFDQAFGAKKQHVVSLTAGGELSSTTYDAYGITERGFLRERGETFVTIPTENTGYYTWLSNNHGTINTTKLNKVGLYATGTYVYNNRYVLNLSVRTDATNNFGTRSNFLPIWAVSGRWDIKEDILKKVKWVDALSLKASMGYQGNMLDSETPNLIIRHGSYSNLYDDYTSTVENFPNPNLKFEKKLSTNYALDFSLWNRLLNGNISFFYNKTKDAFLNKTVSLINGVNQYVVNRGNISNTGIELTLNFTPFNNVGASGSKRGFTWRFDPQFGQVVNKLIKYAINDRNKTFQDELRYTQLLDGTLEIPEEPIGTFYSYKYKGLNPENGQPMFEGIDQEEFEKIYDATEDKKDVYFMVMEKSGTRIPIIQGGINNYFAYRDFSLTLNFTYSLGNKIRLLKLCSGYASQTPKPQENMRKEFVDRWRRPGDEAYTDIPALSTAMYSNQAWYAYKPYAFTSSLYEMYDYSNLRVASGNFLRLQTMQFQYRLSEKACKWMGISSAYIGIVGTNLYTWCAKELKGQNPEQSGTSDVINLAIRPTYSLNLNISF